MEPAEAVRTCPFDYTDALEFDPELRSLLYEEPVAKVRMSYGQGAAWVVTRYEDIRMVTTDRRFSREAVNGRDFPRITPQPIAPPGSIFMLDPPANGRMRAALARAFAPRPVERMRQQTQAIVDDLLESMIAGPGAADIMSALAQPLPTLTINKILGIPTNKQAWLKEQAGTLKRTDPSHLAAAAQVHENLRTYLSELVQERRRQPDEDLLSALANPPTGEESLGDDELISLAISLILTGHDNITDEIGDIVYTLLTRPDLVASARADLPRVLEEMLRYVPFRRGVGTPRVALEDVEVGGTTIKAGDIVHVSYLTANHDPSKFSSPDDIDIDRPPVRHMAFGWGIHHCPAEPLARMELETALGTLLNRLPGLKLAIPADEVRWDRSTVNRVPLALPVAW